jgi:nucleoside-diphosphate-sugar epimerase
MRILLIGGNGFIGRFAVAALKQQGHALAVFHRGTTALPAGWTRFGATVTNSTPTLRT